MGLLPMILRRIQAVLFQTPQVARLKEQNEAPPHSPGVRSAPSSPAEIAPRGEECLSQPPYTRGLGVSSVLAARAWMQTRRMRLI